MVSPAFLKKSLEEWHEMWAIWPCKTISGQYIKGKLYRRYVLQKPISDSGGSWKIEYATEKELFKHKLETGSK